jgi:hypothetical protein
VNSKFVAAKPTPGEPNSTVRIPKPVVTVQPKTSSKKVVSKAKPQILDGTSTVAEEAAEAPEPTSTAMVAAAVVPLDSNSNSFMPWAYGTLALGVAGAAAVFVARQKKKNEWDIEEIA